MIEFFPFQTTEKTVFSILIPTWNNLELLKFCIKSIKQNSKFNHQIIVHVNENKDNTTGWLNENNISHSVSIDNQGICKGLNAAFSMSKSDYIVYLNDDMYVCPNWDEYLYNEILDFKTDYFYLSGSLIEPKFTGNKSVSAPFDFGKSPSEFDENQFLLKYNTIDISDKNGSSWPPSVLHRRLWNIIGGYSIEFSPGMYSDPDISMKLWQIGVRIFKISGKSRIYHFMSKSTGKVKRNNGRKQFLKKWGISSSTFYKFYLKMGTEYKGELKNPIKTNQLKLRLFKDKLKLLFMN